MLDIGEHEIKWTPTLLTIQTNVKELVPSKAEWGLPQGSPHVLYEKLHLGKPHSAYRCTYFLHLH